MAQENIFIWLAEEMLKGEFIEWVKKSGHTGISYSMLSRAQDRQRFNKDLTIRQQKAARLAAQFKTEKTVFAAQAQAA